MIMCILICHVKVQRYIWLGQDPIRKHFTFHFPSLGAWHGIFIIPKNGCIVFSSSLSFILYQLLTFSYGTNQNVKLFGEKELYIQVRFLSHKVI